MKSLNNWLVEYSESHQNKINQAIHKVAVPIIVFSILGLLWCLPLFNGAIAITIASLLYYFILSFKVGSFMLPYALIQLFLINYLFIKLETLFLPLMIFLFVISWIMQFVGHHIEGKRPSFFKDLQFLLIGPIWVFRSYLFLPNEQK